MNVRACLRCGGLLAALLLFFGCSSNTKSPFDPASSFDTPSGVDASRPIRFGSFGRNDISRDRFFPLDSGSVWVYTLELRTTLVDSTAPPQTFAEHGSVVTTMGGAYDVEGTPYTLSTETTRIPDDRVFELAIFYRQDATGLYELDSPLPGLQTSVRVSALQDAFAARIARQPPAARSASLRALASLESKVARVERLLHAAGPHPATGPQGQPEIQRLAYPLFIGREWIVRPDPLFTERVDARQTIRVAGQRLSAWRIRIESEFFGPDDRVWFWVSPEGELRFRYHLVGPAVDDTGNVIGIYIAEEDQELVQYQLAGQAEVGSGLVPKLPFGGGSALRAAPGATSTR